MKTNVVSFETKPASFLENPVYIQRLEGLMVLLGSLWAWHALGGNWWVFAATVLLPDLSMLGYLASPRLGARLYNLVHSYPLAALALVLGTVLPNPLLVFAGILLLAHIGWDRSLGYGLKLASGFKDSHLGRLGQ